MPEKTPHEPLPELTEEELDALLLEGINSGPAEPMTAQDWADIRANAEAFIARRQRARTGKPGDAPEPGNEGE